MNPVTRLNAILMSLGAFAVLFASPVKAEPYPLEYWALRDVISNVSVSPDGNRVALLRIPNRDSNPVLEVYDAANFEAEPFRMDGTQTSINALYYQGNL